MNTTFKGKHSKPINVIKKISSIFLLLHLSLIVFSQNSIKGVVTDADNGESVIGCNILLQGTTIGTVTDFDGNYEFKNVPAGSYNIIFSFISYDKSIQKVEIGKNKEIKLDVKLKSSSQVMKDVVVTAKRRTDTELTMLTAVRSSLTIANGITSQQIARSQDKDASEVIRRVPGVTIRDGKFVIVRGLTERYNSVWLNSTSTPSSESDVRAFSFDVIPSGQIDNILIYKTPAPELPADFAGAMINIKTKSLIDGNGISATVSTGFLEGTTGSKFYTYKGSNTDWLGFDNSQRVLPTNFPTTAQVKDFHNQTTAEEINQINTFSKLLNKVMTPSVDKAKPDVDVQFAINRRFTLGSFSLGNITAIGYNASNTSTESFRAAYWSYPDTSYNYLQNEYNSKVRINLLSNWTLTFGNNQRIEFRNIFNNYGSKQTILKQGHDFYQGSNDRSYELGYESRATYSGQLAGSHKFNNDKINLEWILGYSYANKNQPDIRRMKMYTFDEEPETQYTVGSSTQVLSNNFSRLFLRNEENILNGAVNYSHKISLGEFSPEIKTGVFLEKKNRSFDSRSLGYIRSPKSRLRSFGVESFNNTPAFDDALFTSIQNFFDTKIDYATGLVLSDATQAADSYTAENSNTSGYLALNLPINKWLNVYVGARFENNKLLLDGYKRDGTDTNPIHVQLDSLNIFPSLNTTLNISEKLLFRLAGGQTVNRPEFREVSPFIFYDFEENVTTYGNPNVVNAYITNADARFEWYPTQEEIVSAGVFYKNFKNPIESKILYTGSGWNYTFANAPKAESYGVEFDARKRLHEFENSSSFRFLSNFTLVVNASYIKSKILTNTITEGVSSRPLQGQSPYIINFGVYYNDLKSKIMGSIMYNKTGKRIAVVGDKDVPNIFEMPFNSLDFTLEKGINNWMSIKFGVKNLLNDDVVFQQFQDYTDNGVKMIREQVTNMYKPGRQFKLGLSIKL